MKLNILLQPTGCKQKSHDSVTLDRRSKKLARSDLRIRYSAFLEEKNCPFHLIPRIALKTFVVRCSPRHSPVLNESSKKSSLFVQKTSMSMSLYCHFKKQPWDYRLTREESLCVLNLFYTLFVVKLGAFTFQLHDSIVRYGSRHDWKHDTYDKQS